MYLKMKRNNNCYAIKLSAIEVKSLEVGKHESINEFLGKYSKHVKNAISFRHKDIA